MKSIVFIAACLAPVGCQPATQDPAVGLGPSAHVAAANGPAAHESCGGEKSGHESCGACGGEPGAAPVPDTVATRADPETGATIAVVGTKLGAATAVKVADLLAKPDDFVGKTIRLEGNVSAMCGHRRAWFAVQSEDRSGNSVRVFAAPAFLVPAGSVGKRARTEGQVERVAARGDGQAQIVVRATGAEFL